MSEAHKLTTHNVLPAGQVKRLNSPASEPYVHQAWPSTRHHPSGEARVVENEEEAAELGPEWRELPYHNPSNPKSVASAAIPAPRHLTEDHERLKEAHESLLQSHDALANDKNTLQTEVEELSVQLRTAQAAYENLQRQHAMVKGQLTAARKRAGDSGQSDGDSGQSDDQGDKKA
jgi:hypothetical protein